MTNVLTATFIIFCVSSLNLALLIYMKIKYGPIYTEEENKLTEADKEQI